MHYKSNKRVQGHLLIIGGGEERSGGGMAVLTRFVELSGGTDKPIIVLTAASKLGAALWQQYRNAFTELGVLNLTHVHFDSPEEAASEKALAALGQAGGVFMTGGAQKRLMQMLRDTPFLNEMRKAYHERGACIAGTSAGASAMSRLMLADGRSELEPAKGMIEFESGTGLAPHIVVDQHFAQRGRLPRLLTAITEHPELYGVGIDEDTALAICPGQAMEVVGEGAVTVLDGRTMLSNVAEIGRHDAPRIIGVRLHVLPSGTSFQAAATEGPGLAPEPFADFFNALIELDHPQ